MRHPKALAAAALGVAGYAELQWLGRTFGTTPSERHGPMPGDELVPEPDAVTTHATTIDAPPADVWPWLVQMGWGRGQWYTARWVDRMFFPNNGPSADRIVPEWQELTVGDRILDGPPEAHCAFVVQEIAPEQHLVLLSEEHLPPAWAEKYDAALFWGWSFALEPLSGGLTRFIFRSRFRLEPAWVRAVYLGMIVPADFVMGRQMLRGVKWRAEHMTEADRACAVPA